MLRTAAALVKLTARNQPHPKFPVSAPPDSLSAEGAYNSGASSPHNCLSNQIDARAEDYLHGLFRFIIMRQIAMQATQFSHSDHRLGQIPVRGASVSSAPHDKKSAVHYLLHPLKVQALSPAKPPEQLPASHLTVYT
jgi:hypothetical protein